MGSVSHLTLVYCSFFCVIFQGLKSHAVTMFEVGKLSDESLDSFLSELEKVGTQIVVIFKPEDEAFMCSY